MSLETIITIISTMGGFEAIKWGVTWYSNRKNLERVEDAKADQAEYNTLEHHIEFLQNQLLEKEKRFAEQTDRLRQSQEDLFRAKQELAECLIKLAKITTWQCDVKGCLKRNPPNGM